MTFVPPKVNENVWATYVEKRQPKFKVHSSEGLANSAVSYHFPEQNVIMYTLQDGEWAVYREFIVPKVCDDCGKDFTRDRWDRIELNRPYRQRGRAKFNDPIICRPCWTKEYNDYTQKAKEKQERQKLKELQAKYGD